MTGACLIFALWCLRFFPVFGTEADGLGDIRPHVYSQLLSLRNARVFDAQSLFTRPAVRLYRANVCSGMENARAAAVLLKIS